MRAQRIALVLVAARRLATCTPSKLIYNNALRAKYQPVQQQKKSQKDTSKPEVFALASPSCRGFSGGKLVSSPLRQLWS